MSTHHILTEASFIVWANYTLSMFLFYFKFYLMSNKWLYNTTFWTSLFLKKCGETRSHFPFKSPVRNFTSQQHLRSRHATCKVQGWPRAEAFGLIRGKMLRSSTDTYRPVSKTFLKGTNQYYLWLLIDDIINQSVLLIGGTHCPRHTVLGLFLFACVFFLFKERFNQNLFTH